MLKLTDTFFRVENTMGFYIVCLMGCIRLVFFFKFFKIRCFQSLFFLTTFRINKIYQNVQILCSSYNWL